MRPASGLTLATYSINSGSMLPTLQEGDMVGADSMSRAVGVPTYIADVIVAVALISVLVATMFTQYRLRFK